MYVCMYVCMYAFTYVCMCLFMYVCIYVCMCVSIYTYISCVCIYTVQTYIYIYVYVCVHICIYMIVHICVCIYAPPRPPTFTFWWFVAWRRAGIIKTLQCSKTSRILEPSLTKHRNVRKFHKFQNPGTCDHRGAASSRILEFWEFLSTTALGEVDATELNNAQKIRKI